ncbi:hypothetical protein SU32_03160 [Ahrensia marina]|uniref:Uncharacterized protein n=1 Tax=Ahrensia marina TaxID=1514904 RepID=A0A0M9GP04_9HYPH|nr:hypothetical protein SU32_03160 [Ahrensia marina]
MGHEHLHVNFNYEIFAEAEIRPKIATIPAIAVTNCNRPTLKLSRRLSSIVTPKKAATVAIMLIRAAHIVFDKYQGLLSVILHPFY